MGFQSYNPDFNKKSGDACRQDTPAHFLWCQLDPESFSRPLFFYFTGREIWVLCWPLTYRVHNKIADGHTADDSATDRITNL